MHGRIALENQPMPDQSSRDRMQSMLQCLPIALITLDSAGRVLRADYDYWQRIGFLEAGSLEGATLSDAIPAESLSSVWSAVEQLATQDQAASEGNVVEGRWLQVYGKAIVADECRHCELVVHDLTEQRMQADGVKRQAEVMQQINQDLPAMLFQSGGDRAGTEAVMPVLSEGSRAFLGRDPQEIIDDPALIYEAIHPEDRRAYYEAAFHAVEKLSTISVDLRLVSVDGQAHWLRVLSHPRELPGDRIMFSGVAVPIGDLIEEIENLRKSCEEFGQFTHERWHALLEARRSLEQATESNQQAQGKLIKEQRTLAQLIDQQDRQRLLLSYDLHDGFVQDVVGAKMILEGLQQKSAETSAELEVVYRSLERAIAEARRLIRDLRPLLSDGESLVDAVESIREASRATGVEISFEHEVLEESLPHRVATHALRIIQESVSNVRRHAQTDSASVSMKLDDDVLCIEVVDQGVGFDPSAVSGQHYGLEGIRQRARLLGGHARIESEPGEGTRVSIELPL